MAKLNVSAIYMRVMSKKEYLRIFLIVLLCFVLSRFIMVFEYANMSGEWSFSKFVSDGMHHWDAEWYETYAKSLIAGDFALHTRNNGEAVWAFFPLFPMIVGMFYELFGESISIPALAFVINGIFMMAGEIIAYKYILFTRKNKKAGLWYIFFMSFGIFSFYCSTMYTEALFMLLFSLSLYCLKKEKYLTMGLFGALLSATRNTGVLFVFVILVNQIMDYIKLENRAKSLRDFIRYEFGKTRLVLGTVMIPMGLFAYMLYLRYELGDGLAFVHVQKSWGRINQGMWSSFMHELLGDFPPSLLAFEFMAIAALIILIIKSKRYDEAIYPIIVLLIATNTSLMSIGRFAFGSFTLMLAFIDRFDRFGKSFKILTAAAAVCIEYAFVIGWFNSALSLI